MENKEIIKVTLEEICNLQRVDVWKKTTTYKFMNERVACERVIKIEGRNQQRMIWYPGSKEKRLMMVGNYDVLTL